MKTFLSTILLLHLLILPGVYVAYGQPIPIKGSDAFAVQAMGTDLFGNLYATGYLTGEATLGSGSDAITLTSIGLKDIFLARWSADGFLEWAFSMGGIDAGPGLDDEGLDLAVCPGGEVYITGYMQGRLDVDPGDGELLLQSAGFKDIFVAGYTSAGQIIEGDRYGGPSDDRGQGIFCDAGYVYLTGLFRDEMILSQDRSLTSNGLEDIFLFKHTRADALLWAKSWGSSSLDEGRRITLEGDDIILLGGFSGNVALADQITITSSNSSYDAFLGRFTEDGEAVWVKAFGGPQADGAQDLTRDLSGNLYVSGHFNGRVDFDQGSGNQIRISRGVRDSYLVSFSNTGRFRWVRQMGESLARTDHVEAGSGGTLFLATSFTGNVTPEGSERRFSSRGEEDILLSAYNASGIYQTSFLVGSSGADYGTSLAVGPMNFFLGASHEGAIDVGLSENQILDTNANSNNFIVGYPFADYLATSIEELPHHLTSLKTYPNPFSDELKIEFTPDGRGRTHVELVDPLGRVLQRISTYGGETDLIRKRMNTSGLPAGTYYVRIRSFSGEQVIPVARLHQVDP